MAVPRTATPADVAAIAALVVAFGAEFDDAPDPGVAERIAAAMADRTTFLVLGKPPLGFVAIAQRRPYWTSRPEVHVDDLYGVPHERGRGTAGRCWKRRSPARRDAYLGTESRGCGTWQSGTCYAPLLTPETP